MSNRGETYITTSELAEAVGVSRGTIQRWVKTGKLQPAQVITRGKWTAYLFTRSSVPQAEGVRRSQHPGRPRKKR